MFILNINVSKVSCKTLKFAGKICLMKKELLVKSKFFNKYLTTFSTPSFILYFLFFCQKFDIKLSIELLNCQAWK